MKRRNEREIAGFALLELLIVIAIISILASIAIPNYATYRKQAKAVSCLSVRRDIELQEIARITLNTLPTNTRDRTAIKQQPLKKVLEELISRALPWYVNESWASTDTDTTVPAIDPAHTCPSGGTYLWLISDPQQEGYPKAGCSIHYGTIQVVAEDSPVFNIPSGGSISFNGDFESIDKAPKAKSWKLIPDSKISGWQSSTGRLELWASGMLGVKAPDGDYFIELDTDRNKKKPDSISQQVETEAGRVYIVQLKAQARKAGTSDFEILWNGENVSTISPETKLWKDYTVKVVGNGQPMTLALAEITGQNNGLGALLDSISVIATNETR